MTVKLSQFVGGTPPRSGGNGEVCPDRPGRPLDPKKIAIGSPQGDDLSVPKVLLRGESGISTRTNCGSLSVRGQQIGDLPPELKSWVDNVIVPALVREYLAEMRSEEQLAQARESAKTQHEDQYLLL